MVPSCSWSVLEVSSLQEVTALRWAIGNSGPQFRVQKSVAQPTGTYQQELKQLGQGLFIVLPRRSVLQCYPLRASPKGDRLLSHSLVLRGGFRTCLSSLARALALMRSLLLLAPEAWEKCIGLKTHGLGGPWR